MINSEFNNSKIMTILKDNYSKKRLFKINNKFDIKWRQKGGGVKQQQQQQQKPVQQQQQKPVQQQQQKPVQQQQQKPVPPPIKAVQDKKVITPTSSPKSPTSSESPIPPKEVKIISQKQPLPDQTTLKVSAEHTAEKHDVYKNEEFIQQTFPVKQEKALSNIAKGTKKQSQSSKKKSSKESAITVACDDSRPPFYNPKYNVET